MSVTAAVLAGTTLTSLLFGINAYSHKPNPLYFLADENGQIYEITPASQPYFKEGQVINFAVEAITKAMTMNFVTWRQDLAEATEYFQRPAGWNNYLAALEGSGTLEMIRNRRLISSVVANGAAIVNHGQKGDSYFWVIQVPITITYQSSSEKTTENRLAEIEVSRIPTTISSKGMGITRVLIK